MQEKFFYIWFAFVGLAVLLTISGIAFVVVKLLQFFGVM